MHTNFKILRLLNR